MGGKLFDRHRVLARDRQLSVPVVEQSPAQKPRIDAEVVASEGSLDGDLPDAGRAEQELIARIGQEGARRLRDTLAAASVVKQGRIYPESGDVAWSASARDPPRS